MSENVAPDRARGVAAAIVDVLATALALSVSGSAFAASSDTQTVQFTISNISEIDVNDGAITLNVSAATAGAQPDAVTATSSYDITTNASQNGKKLTASLNANMPASVTLSVNVAAPGNGSTSQGALALSTTAVDVVTGIQGVATQGAAITYTLSATVDAAAAPQATRTVTYTVVDL